MEYTELHQQKIQILGRLIKESSLTLDEALVLLKEDVQPVFQPTPSYVPGLTGPWTPPIIYGNGTLPLTGTIAVKDSYGGLGFNNTTTTALYSNTPQTPTADTNT
jgi:hypothetical protein